MISNQEKYLDFGQPQSYDKKEIANKKIRHPIT